MALAGPFGGKASARIFAIRVPAIDASHLCGNLAEVIGYALGEAGYEPDELPPFAAQFQELWIYVGEWMNGGHAQFAGNTCNDFDAWRRVSALLGHIGLERYREILDDFIAFVVANEERIDDLYREGEEQAAIRLFWEFDDQFHAAERDGPGIERGVRDWLIGQAWLSIEPSDPPFMDWVRQFIPPHPLAEKRKAARLRRRIAENRGANLAFLQRLRQLLGGGSKR